MFAQRSVSNKNYRKSSQKQQSFILVLIQPERTPAGWPRIQDHVHSYMETEIPTPYSLQPQFQYSCVHSLVFLVNLMVSSQAETCC